jgi:hypothetical protein
MQSETKKRDSENLTLGQRGVEVITGLAVIFLLGFLVYHDVAATGFYTAEFGFLERVALYGPLILSPAAPWTRAITGRRNPARLAEALTSLCLALGSLWLLIIFPLDYTHLSDALPGPLRPLLDWVTDDLARFILILQVIIGPITAIILIGRYFRMARRSP